MDQDCRRAMALMEDGSAQTTRAFKSLVSNVGHPYDVHASILKLLARLKKQLNDANSRLMLVRLSKRGQRGLYKLVERRHITHDRTQEHQTPR